MKNSIKTLALAAISSAALLSQAADAAPSLSIQQGTPGAGQVSFAVSIDNPEALITSFNINLALANVGSFVGINWGGLFGTIEPDFATCLGNLSCGGYSQGTAADGSSFGALALTDFFGVTDALLQQWQNYDTNTSTYAPSVLLATLTFNTVAGANLDPSASIADDACPGPNPNNPDATFVGGHAAGAGNDGTTDGYIYPACAQPVPEPGTLGLLGLGLLGAIGMRRRVAA